MATAIAPPDPPSIPSEVPSARSSEDTSRILANKAEKSDDGLSTPSDQFSDLEKGPTGPLEQQQQPRTLEQIEYLDTRRRWGITASMGSLVFAVTFAIFIFSVNSGYGFVFDPIAFGPMSEVMGRHFPRFSGYILFAIFQIPVALTQNVATICVAYTICIFVAGGFAGPVTGPIAGGFITESHLGWRWTSWITLIMAGFLGSIGYLIIPETFLYGIVYLLFEAYSISPHEQRGWNLGVASLPLAAFTVGIPPGAALITYSATTKFTRAFVKHGKSHVVSRSFVLILNVIVCRMSNPHIPWPSQVLSTVLIGLGYMVPFRRGMPYLIGCYGFYSNSAIAVNAFIRSIFGAFFPSFMLVIYKRLGVEWASSLLGFLCVVFAPVPVLFNIYGKRIRERSPWVPRG
ncbi:MFS general substrate transporter [Lojkania enalia]|uniref:MFS general substrate transporter n=1 Tax=Lojkania enalia TaxID=147567 RepID=A0A9P4JW52_9PLEO|nr:MFS general substrate transporter [Didymosphaeria enalia]